jgi:hypothetical protein
MDVEEGSLGAMIQKDAALHTQGKLLLGVEVNSVSFFHSKQHFTPHRVCTATNNIPCCAEICFPCFRGMVIQVSLRRAPGGYRELPLS